MKGRNFPGKKRKATPGGTSSKQVRTGNSRSMGGKRTKRFQGEDDAEAYWAAQRKRQKMELKIADGKLIIMLPLIAPPQLSRSGKSNLVACSYGIKRTPLLIEDRPVHVGVTAFTYRDCVPPARWLPLLEIPKSEEEEEEEALREFESVPLLG